MGSTPHPEASLRPNPRSASGGHLFHTSSFMVWTLESCPSAHPQRLAGAPSPSPTLSAACSSQLTREGCESNIALGRARRGTSGALYPKSAIAGLNSRPRPDVLWDCLCRVVLKIGPCAAESYEPREVRKEAAVSSRFWVPQDLLVGAVRQRKAIRQGRSLVHDPYFVLGGLLA